MNQDISKIIERFGISQNFIFLYKGSHAAEFAAFIDSILKNYPNKQLGEDFCIKLFDLKDRFAALFSKYHQDYLDDPDIADRVDRYRKNLGQFSVLALEFRVVLKEFRNIKNDKEIRLIPQSTITEESLARALNASEKIIEDIVSHFNELQTAFAEK